MPGTKGMKGGGGKRSGAGRPLGSTTKKPQEMSDDFKAGLIAALEAAAKLNGKSVQEELVDMVYDKNLQDTVRISALKMVTDLLSVKESHKVIEDYKIGVLELPTLKGKEEEAGIDVH